jgi:WD40 repeat protein
MMARFAYGESALNDQPGSTMHIYRILGCGLLLVIYLNGCRFTPITPAVKTPVIEYPQPTYTSRITSTSITSQIPPTQYRPIVPQQSATANQVSTPEIPASISAENVGLLKEKIKFQYSSWNLVLGTAWSPDSRLLAVAAGNDVHIYSSQDLKEVTTLPTPVWVTSLAFDPQNRFIATSNLKGDFTLWDLSTFQADTELSHQGAHKKGINQIVFSPDGQFLATAANDGLVRIWSTQTGALYNEIIGGSFAIPAIAFTDMGSNLAIVNGNLIRIRDIQTSRFVHTLRGNQVIQSVAIHPNGNLLASGIENNSIQLWDIASETQVGELAVLQGQEKKSSPLIWQVAFNPDGTLIAAAESDATTLIWNSRTQLLLTTLAGHTKAVTCVSFSPDGRLLATGSLDASVVLWEISRSP